MRFWMTGMFASALTGLVWVGLWHLVLTMMAILATGASLPLALGPAAFSGLVAGVFAGFQRPASSRNRRIACIALIACLLFAFSLGAPFDPSGLLALWQRVLLRVGHAATVAGAVGHGGRHAQFEGFLVHGLRVPQLRRRHSRRKEGFCRRGGATMRLQPRR